MPPKPQWNREASETVHTAEQRLPSGRRPRGHAHDQGNAHAQAEATGRRQGPVHAERRWSYVLQDLPDMLSSALHDVNKGYILRLCGVTVAVAGVSYAVYSFIASRQNHKPLAKRWTAFARPVPITLLEKTREEHSNMYTYRFALPHSYDYAGYDPVSSVRLISGDVRELSSLSRWYTPISHPEERGIIEFAIKDCDPGRMSARLRQLERGDVVHLGRWMKEFDYEKAKRRAAQAGADHAELGLICTTGGASVALQLMNIIDKDPRDNTKLTVLYCHHSARHIPFRESHFAPYEARNPDRLSMKYNVLSLGKPPRNTRAAVPVNRRGSDHAVGSPASLTANEKPVDEWAHVGINVFLGNLDPETIQATMPPPVRAVAPHASADAKEAHVETTGSQSFVRGASLYRPQILVCGPQSLLSYVSGRVSPLSNRTYWQGPFFRYNGFLKDMGYDRKQVYKFGVSTHFLAMH